MDKALFTADVLDCAHLLEETDDCTLTSILWDITGNQNIQIQIMYHFWRSRVT
jgi:hypothetical protein